MCTAAASMRTPAVAYFRIYWKGKLDSPITLYFMLIIRIYI